MEGRNAEVWAARLGNLKRVGQQWQGPCPICGGEDRFWVKADGGYGCRQCQPGKDNPDAARAIERAVWGEQDPSDRAAPGKVTRYTYTDAAGKALFYACRRDFSDGRPKQIWQEKVGEKYPKPRPLYNLPALLADPDKPVLVVEGEKTAEAAARLYPGFTVTTSSQGSGNARHTDLTPLQGRTAIIWPDFDSQGREYAAEVRAEIEGAAVYQYPEGFQGKKGWDAADPDPAGYSKPTEAELLALPAVEAEPRQRRSRSLGDMLAEPKEPKPWLWAGQLTAGRLSMVESQPGVGKSVMGRGLANAVARGKHFLNRATMQGTVLMMVLEDDTDQIELHMMRMGAEAGNAPPIQIWDVNEDPPDDLLQALREEVETVQPALVIVDPMIDFMAHVQSISEAGEVNKPLVELKRLAKKSGAHIMLIHHAGKNDTYLGSTAFKAAVDVQFHIEDKNGEHVLTRLKQRRMDADPWKPTTLRLDPETWELTADMSLADIQHDTPDPVEEKAAEVLNWAEGQSGPWTYNKGFDAIGGKREHYRAALDRLTGAGRLVRHDKGKAQYYQVLPPVPPVFPGHTGEHLPAPVPPVPLPIGNREQGTGHTQGSGEQGQDTAGTPGIVDGDGLVRPTRQRPDTEEMENCLRMFRELETDEADMSAFLDFLEQRAEEGDRSAKDALLNLIFSEAKKDGTVAEIISALLDARED